MALANSHSHITYTLCWIFPIQAGALCTGSGAIQGGRLTWGLSYATGGEIQDYLEKICNQYNIDKNVHLESKVISAIWEEESGTWALKIQQKDRIIEDRCNVLINGSGVLK